MSGEARQRYAVRWSMDALPREVGGAATLADAKRLADATIATRDAARTVWVVDLWDGDDEAAIVYVQHRKAGAA